MEHDFPLKQNQGSSLVVRRHSMVLFGFWLIIPFASFAIHNIFLIPPTLVFFGLGSLLVLLFSRYVSNTAILFLPLMTVTYFVVSQTLMGAPFVRYMGVIFAIGYFIIVLGFGGQLSIDQRFSLIDKFIKYSVVLLIVECAWRLTHPDLSYQGFEQSGDIRWIYQYKLGGLMYVDSNVVAFHLMTLFFFVLYLQHEHNVKYAKAKWILIILIALTFSRAVWIASIFGVIYVSYFRGRTLLFYFINFVGAVVLLGFVYVFYLRERIVSDLSFKSKLYIIDVVAEYLKSASAQELLFGIGFSNSLVRLDIYAHNFFMVFLIESGAIGFALIITLFLQFIFITRGKALFILVPFFISTMSNTVTFMPYFYVIIALIVLFYKDKASNPSVT